MSNILSPIDEDVRAFNTENQVNRSWEFLSADAYYTIKLDSNGQKLEFDVNVSQFETDKTNLISSIETNGRTNDFLDIRDEQPGVTKFWVGKMDYTLTIHKAVELQTGAKYIGASIDKNFKSEYFKEGIWNFNSNESNHFQFDETIVAAYSKLSVNIEDWQMTTDLRYEDSKS